MDHIIVLKALQELPFNVGKKLLTEFLQGQTSESIKRNSLNKLSNFGSLGYDNAEIGQMIDMLIAKGMIKQKGIKGKKFWKVLEITPKGVKEIKNPTEKKEYKPIAATVITDAEREVFKHFGDVLDKYNDEQKKAIISPKNQVLCIAGAGSGKTTVLTKRIEFLTKYRSVDPQKILAITFTRKARQEMLSRIPQEGVLIETFNSFCEKILRMNEGLIYDKPVSMMSYKDKIQILNLALKKNKMTIKQATYRYFTTAQRRGKSDNQLMNIFMNDCFFVRDYFLLKNKPLTEEAFETDEYANVASAQMVYQICKEISSTMKKRCLRDFADQLNDTIHFFEKNPSLVPQFEHILVDEYQDVNSTQIKLINLLKSPNLFCVGDPRQSIFGWRGSDISYILNFKDEFPDSEIITLTKNYRSTKPIVDLINLSIKDMGLADLNAHQEGDDEIKLIKFKNSGLEQEFVVQQILNSKTHRNEIFVLARTNKQLTELSQRLNAKRIKHVVRNDEVNRSVEVKEGDVTLATVHAIKGLEAEEVYLIGCNSSKFPCKGSDHPVIEMIKVDEYDKEEEEKRLFYVAMSRAKRKLTICYTGSVTYFVNQEMLKKIDSETKEVTIATKTQKSAGGSVESRLRQWRSDTSSNANLPAYVIMHDKTLLEIAQNMPLTKQDLYAISGMGPTKVLKYGEEILDIVRG